MDYKKIELSDDGTFFTLNGKKVFKSFISALKFHEPGLAPVQDESGWYHINTNGEPIYPQRYKRAFGYYHNRAAVIDHDDNWFHIDIQGNRLYSDNYAWCGNFQENLCPVRDFENKYFHIDLEGKRIYKENYRYAGDFKDGYAVVCLNNGLCKHINKSGKDLNGKLFKDLGVFHKSFATAQDSKGWFHIDKKGNELYPERYAMIEPFYNGYALVKTFDMTKKVIGENGKTVLFLYN